MKIVHVVRQYPPSIGGLEDSVSNLCVQLSRMPGVEVGVVTLDRLFSDPGKKLPTHEVIDGIDVKRIPFFGSHRYPIAPSVLAAIKDADIVHVHAIDFFFDFLSATRFLHRKPLIASTHGGFFHTSFASGLKKLWFKTITRFSSSAYGVLCASSENDAINFRQIAKTEVVTIENGVNIEKWAGAGSATPKRTMIFIGRWSFNKRIPILFALLGALRRLDLSWRLVVAGIEDNESKDDLLISAEEANVVDAVTFCERPTDAEIKTLLSDASYIASASSYEGFGISAIEGLSAGLLPILSPIPTFEKFKNQLGMGFTIDLDDIEASAKRIEEAHANGLASYGEARRKCMLFSQKFQWANTAQKFLIAYKNALAEKQAAPALSLSGNLKA